MIGLVPDPAGLAAVDLTNPQTWNRYAYVANNPLSNVDPLGLDCTTASGESCGSSGTPFITKNVSAPYYPGGWWDLAYEGWPGQGSMSSFFCMLFGGCSNGVSAGSSGEVEVRRNHQRSHYQSLNLLLSRAAARALGLD